VTDLLSSRRSLLAGRDPRSAATVARLFGIAEQALRRAYADGEFVFTLRGNRGQDGAWLVHPVGTSLRYAAITALGLIHQPEALQRSVLGGETGQDLITRLAKRLPEVSNIGDVALVCWAAAEAEHEAVDMALQWLAELQRNGAPAFVVEAAWVVSALVAARRNCDVEERLSRARAHLLGARSVGLYPHVVEGEAGWYRRHVGSFAAQVYPIQALARLHGSADDQQALEVANAVAESICALQGKEGQWWWHYDARTAGVVEGYPVYSVHQHSMGPMALLDLAEAGGDDHLDSICQGIRWLDTRPESTEALILDDPPLTWRKVSRSDQRKLVRGLRAAATRIAPGPRLVALDRVFPPGAVDYECRPYEFGWLLMTWDS
jgi:hypothetical protein